MCQVGSHSATTHPTCILFYSLWQTNTTAVQRKKLRCTDSKELQELVWKLPRLDLHGLTKQWTHRGIEVGSVFLLPLACEEIDIGGKKTSLNDVKHGVVAVPSKWAGRRPTRAGHAWRGTAQGTTPTTPAEAHTSVDPTRSHTEGNFFFHVDRSTTVKYK